jgi:L(+)-tartrate dehydratase alpha subunit
VRFTMVLLANAIKDQAAAELEPDGARTERSGGMIRSRFGAPGELMVKAAIEIPDDYLAGLRRCADTKGDLSSFVIQAMLKLQGRPRTGGPCAATPAALVRQFGNRRASKAGRCLEAALRRATARAAEVPSWNRVHPAHRPQQQCRHQCAGDRIRLHPDADWVDLTTAQGGLFGPTTACCFRAMG